MNATDQIDLVIFEIGGIRYGADLSQVRRIDVDDPTESVGRPLGEPTKGARALVFEVGGGHERRLAVDVVHGVSRVPVSDLRRMPAAAPAAPFSIGAWLDGDAAILLIDLFSIISPVPATP